MCDKRHLRTTKMQVLGTEHQPAITHMQDDQHDSDVVALVQDYIPQCTRLVLACPLLFGMQVLDIKHEPSITHMQYGGSS